MWYVIVLLFAVADELEIVASLSSWYFERVRIPSTVQNMLQLIFCAYCTKQVQKETRDINRSRKLKRKLFCSLSCSVKSRNVNVKAKDINKQCLCGSIFSTTTKVKAATHCSASCASHFSMNEQRRQAMRNAGQLKKANLITVADALKLREGWRYAKLEKRLVDVKHEFEWPMFGYVFDLLLVSKTSS